MRLLQKLFTEEDAAPALHVTFEQQDAQAIARRAGLPLTEVEQRLAGMTRKGLLFAVYPADGPIRYQIWPFGTMWDAQAYDLTSDLLQAVGEYLSTREKRPGGQSIPALRTIPVGKSLTSRTMALPYELVGELVKDQKHIAIAPCICRTIAGLSGKGCDVPEESCATFGDFADHAIRSSRARRIDQAELADWLVQANALNLVLQPSNSREIGILCSCCGCCCAVLRGLKAQDRPADVVASSFIARYDADACTGCHTCLDRCQMDALSADGEGVVFDDGRCIGCGWSSFSKISDALSSLVFRLIEMPQPQHAACLMPPVGYPPRTGRALPHSPSSKRLCMSFPVSASMAIRSITSLAVVQQQGDDRRAAALYAESLDLLRGMGLEANIADVLYNLAYIAQSQGHYPLAATLYDESLALFGKQGNVEGMARCRTGLAAVSG